MVFGFFYRKPAPSENPAATSKQSDTGPETKAEANVEAGPSALASQQSESTRNTAVLPSFQFPRQKQLHTPSPSVDNDPSNVISKPRPKRRAPAKKMKEEHVSPGPPGPADTPTPPLEEGNAPSASPELTLVADPVALHALIASVPPQTLHAYTLAHLCPSPASPFPYNTASIQPPIPQTLTVLTGFFSTLVPPPRLHCVRCHQGYFELENGDTACRIAHDDDSAVVERVRTGYNSLGADYETLWGCCGKSVEGDGDMGPPDGWCYEGAHTMDPKRARFRADSSPHDDKLTSCVELRCHAPPLPLRASHRKSASTSSHKRKRSRGATDLDMDGDSVGSNSRGKRSIPVSNSKGKARAKPNYEEEEEEEEEAKDCDEDDGTKPRPAKRAKSLAKKASSVSPANGGRKKSVKKAEPEKEEDAEDMMDVDASYPSTQTLSPPHSPSKSRKAQSTSFKTYRAKTAQTPPASPSPGVRSPNGPPNTKPIKGSPLSASMTYQSQDGDLTSMTYRSESPTPRSHSQEGSTLRRQRSKVEVLVSRSPPKAQPSRPDTQAQVNTMANAKIHALAIAQSHTQAQAQSQHIQQARAESSKAGAKTKTKIPAKSTGESIPRKEGSGSSVKSLSEVVDTSVDGEEAMAWGRA